MKAKRTVAVSNSLTPASMPVTRDCVADIREIITRARRSVVRHVNTTMTLAYWLVGRRIVVEEQQGKRRAAYGEHLLERISRELTADFGNGFGEPQLRNCRLFYKAFPTEDEIRYTLCIKLSWSHLRQVQRLVDFYNLDMIISVGYRVNSIRGGQDIQELPRPLPLHRQQAGLSLRGFAQGSWQEVLLRHENRRSGHRRAQGADIRSSICM